MQIEYYTLIAMMCMYGGIFGLTAINNCLANMSSKGKEFPCHQIKKHNYFEFDYRKLCGKSGRTCGTYGIFDICNKS